MKTLYHGTSEDNFNKIISEGVIKTSFDGYIYCCETEEDVLKFMYIRNFNRKPCIILELQIPEEDVTETFDHSQAFFQCRCFGITKPVPFDDVVDCKKFVFD